MTPLAAWVRRTARPVASTRTWMISLYLLLSVVSGTFWFTAVVAGVSIGLGAAFVYVGVLVLITLPFLWRAGAGFERFAIGAAFGETIRTPYRSAPHGTRWERARLALTDPATWKDLAYLLLLLPLGIVWSSLILAVWGLVLTLAAAPLYIYWVPGRRIDWLVFSAFGLTLDTWWKVVLACVVGVVFSVPAAWIVWGVGWLHAALARNLLGPSRTQELKAEAIRMRDSRDRTMDAAVAERQRIERDLHDGAQQRLIALAMDLGMAQTKLAADPAAAQSLIAHAQAEAKRAIGELRDLARGIHPAMLVERGLDASLSALAGRSPVPVDIRVALPTRPPLEVETIAYFVAAEALTNVAKHAHASRAWVQVYRDATATTLHVEIADDGVGGAGMVTGGGLAGLHSRVIAAGGSLTIGNQPGRATVVHAEIPCAS